MDKTKEEFKHILAHDNDKLFKKYGIALFKKMTKPLQKKNLDEMFFRGCTRCMKIAIHEKLFDDYLYSVNTMRTMNDRLSQFISLGEIILLVIKNNLIAKNIKIYDLYNMCYHRNLLFTLIDSLQPNLTILCMNIIIDEKSYFKNNKLTPLTIIMGNFNVPDLVAGGSPDNPSDIVINNFCNVAFINNEHDVLQYLLEKKYVFGNYFEKYMETNDEKMKDILEIHADTDGKIKQYIERNQTTLKLIKYFVLGVIVGTTIILVKKKTERSS